MDTPPAVPALQLNFLTEKASIVKTEDDCYDETYDSEEGNWSQLVSASSSRFKEERDDFGKTAGQSRTPSPLKDGQAGPDDKNSSFFHTSRDDDLLISCQNKLLEDNLLLLRSILTHTEEIDKGRLDALFAIFDQEELFSVLLRREVHKEANPNVIMRYQSPAQVVLQLVLRKQSLLFLQRPVKQVCKAVGKKGKSKHSSGSMPSPRGSPSHASKGDLEVLLLCQNLHVVTAAVQVILHPFEIPQIACRFSSIAFQIVRTHPSIDESVVHDETLNQYVSRWAVSTVVFLYMIVPAIISPVRVGLLKNEKARGSNDIFLALGKFLLKLCNNARYEEENESRKLLNRTLDVLMPVYSGFCAGVIARGSAVTVPSEYRIGRYGWKNFADYLIEQKARITKEREELGLRIEQVFNILMEKEGEMRRSLENDKERPVKAKMPTSARKTPTSARKTPASAQKKGLTRSPMSAEELQSISPRSARGNPITRLISPRVSELGGGDGGSARTGSVASSSSMTGSEGEEESEMVSRSMPTSPLGFLSSKKNSPRHKSSKESKKKKKNNASRNRSSSTSTTYKNSHNLILGKRRQSNISLQEGGFPDVTLSQGEILIETGSYIKKSKHIEKLSTPGTPSSPDTSSPNTSFHQYCPSPPGLSYTNALGSEVLLSHFKAFLGASDDGRPLLMMDFVNRVEQYKLTFGICCTETQHAEAVRIYKEFLGDSRDMLSTRSLPRLANAKAASIKIVLEDQNNISVEVFDDISYLCSQVLEIVLFRDFLRSRFYSRYKQAAVEEES